jgi:hypothetical protein
MYCLYSSHIIGMSPHDAATGEWHVINIITQCTRVLNEIETGVCAILARLIWACSTMQHDISDKANNGTHTRDVEYQRTPIPGDNILFTYRFINS